jgi:uncharacterized 2Fe-2S/4Fe-4S cluster protein (DUF4445 family)
MVTGEYLLESAISTSERAVARAPEDIVERFLWPGRVGPGVALDMGTTTVMGTIFDRHGNPGTVFYAPNRQAVFGANVIDRLTAAQQPEQRRRLQELGTDSLSAVVTAALEHCDMDYEAWIGVVGNTAMHHLLAGLNIATLSAYPYVPADDGFEWHGIRLQTDSPHGEIEAALVPPLGGFVGSDALASAAIVRQRLATQCWVLIDVGTNCEVMLCIGDRIFFSSAPAGPAFEGGHLSCGMLAGQGAVERISDRVGNIEWTMMGEGSPVGLCGAAAVDFLAVLLRLGRVDASGRFTGNENVAVLERASSIALTQVDIRELQKAKAAVEFCLRGVMKEAKVTREDLEVVVVAGAFGKALHIGHAQEIGLLPLLDRKLFIRAGNLALLGAGLALDNSFVDAIRRRSRRVVLHGKGSGEEYTAALALRPW